MIFLKVNHHDQVLLVNKLSILFKIIKLLLEKLHLHFTLSPTLLLFSSNVSNTEPTL